MTAIAVGAGITSTSLILNDGDTETVLSGGTSSATTINSGGAEIVSAGGRDILSIVSGGGLSDIVGGRAYGTTLAGGVQQVAAGGVTSLTRVSEDTHFSLTPQGGVQVVSAGGRAVDTLLYFGSQTIMGGGIAVGTETAVGGSGAITVEADGTALDASLGGFVSEQFPSLSVGTEIVSAGGLDVSAGLFFLGTQIVLGAASATEIDGGQQVVLSGGVVIDATIDGSTDALGTFAPAGTQTIGAGSTASATTINGGLQIVEPGGTAIDTRNPFGTQAVYGTAIGTVLSGGASDFEIPGSDFVFSGGLTIGNSILDGAAETVEAGGSALGTQVGPGSMQYVFGTVVRAIVDGPGSEDIAAGGGAFGMILSSGAAALVENGASALGTTVGNGAVAFVDGLVSATQVGGQATGGGAVLQIEADGTAFETVVGNDGTLDVSGVAAKSLLSTGGYERIEAGGTARTTIIAGAGAVEIAPGARPGLILFTSQTGGALVLDRSARFAGLVAGFGPGNLIDLPGIAFGDATGVGFTETATGRGGTLTLTDGMQTASINLLGQYAAGGFSIQNDGAGGTLVTYALPSEMSAGSPSAILNTAVHS